MILEVVRCDQCKRELLPGGNGEIDHLTMYYGQSLETSIHLQSLETSIHLHFCPVGCRLLWLDQHQSKLPRGYQE